MINALKLVSINRGHDPRDFTMIAFGGGGPMHAVALAKELGVKRVVIPRSAAVFSAWGMVMSDIRRDVFATALLDLDDAAIESIAARIEELEIATTKEFAAELPPGASPEFQRLAKLRYQGQEHSTEVEISADDLTPDGVGRLQERFRDLFEAEYTYRLDAPIEIVGLHLVASAPSGASPPDPVDLGPTDGSPAVREERTVDFADDGVHISAIYDLERLAPGMSFPGPAIAEGAGTAVVVHPGAVASVDGHHNIIIDITATPEGD